MNKFSKGLIVPEIGDQENGEPMEDDDEANLAEEIDTGGGFFQPGLPTTRDLKFYLLKLMYYLNILENDEDFIDAPNQIHVPFPGIYFFQVGKIFFCNNEDFF